MLETLASGKLHGKPQERASRDGAHKFVTAKLRCAGGDGESLFVGVVAFSDTVKAALLALDDGEPCALAGTLKVGVWESQDGPRPQLDLTASAVLTVHHIKRKRAAIEASRARHETRRTNGAGDGKAREQRQRTPALADDSLDDVAF